MAADPGTAPQRLDRFLWFARLTRTRAAAQRLCMDGHIRIDGRVIDRAHAPVRPGMTITLPIGNRVRVIRVECLPARRGPATEAQLCYVEIG